MGWLSLSSYWGWQNEYQLTVKNETFKCPASEWLPVQNCGPSTRRLLRQHQRSAQSMIPMDGWMDQENLPQQPYASKGIKCASSFSSVLHVMALPQASTFDTKNVQTWMMCKSRWYADKWTYRLIIDNVETWTQPSWLISTINNELTWKKYNHVHKYVNRFIYIYIYISSSSFGCSR